MSPKERLEPVCACFAGMWKKNGFEMARLREGVPTIRFYQLASSSPEAALIGILYKIVEQDAKACVLAKDAEQVRRLDELLWRQPQERFLPHGPWNGPDPSWQPVLIACEPDDRNGATILVLATPRWVEEPDRFDMVVDFVDPKEPVAMARERYRRYQGAGCAMEYWIQSPEGRWTRKEKNIQDKT
ncbi:MAG: DNA polymerase III subunit chi [Magnetococcus sp. YQC-5]